MPLVALPPDVELEVPVGWVEEELPLLLLLQLVPAWLEPELLGAIPEPAATDVAAGPELLAPDLVSLGDVLLELFPEFGIPPLFILLFLLIGATALFRFKFRFAPGFEPEEDEAPALASAGKARLGGEFWGRFPGVGVGGNPEVPLPVKSTTVLLPSDRFPSAAPVDPGGSGVGVLSVLTFGGALTCGNHIAWNLHWSAGTPILDSTASIWSLRTSPAAGVLEEDTDCVCTADSLVSEILWRSAGDRAKRDNESVTVVLNAGNIVKKYGNHLVAAVSRFFFKASSFNERPDPGAPVPEELALLLLLAVVFLWVPADGIVPCGWFLVAVEVTLEAPI
jgi:hypothetical protein